VALRDAKKASRIAEKKTKETEMTNHKAELAKSTMKAEEFLKKKPYHRA
jgi:hypothetical protein